MAKVESTRCLDQPRPNLKVACNSVSVPLNDNNIVGSQLSFAMRQSIEMWMNEFQVFVDSSRRPNLRAWQTTGIGTESNVYAAPFLEHI